MQRSGLSVEASSAANCLSHVAFEIGLLESPFSLILLPDSQHVLHSAGSILELCAEAIGVHLEIDWLR